MSRTATWLTAWGCSSARRWATRPPRSWPATAKRSKPRPRTNASASLAIEQVDVSSRGPGQRAGLTRDRVFAAARELLAERGSDGLSMRTLAARLDVSPNALYSHVDGKTALIDGLLDDVLADVLADVDIPAADAGDPIEGVYTLMTSTYGVLRMHADLVALYLARQGARGPHAQHLGDVVLKLLERAGVTRPYAQEALHVLIVYTIGSAAFATRTVPGPVAPSSATADDHAARFDHGLSWLLAGIAQPTSRMRST